VQAACGHSRAQDPTVLQCASVLSFLAAVASGSAIVDWAVTLPHLPLPDPLISQPPSHTTAPTKNTFSCKAPTHGDCRSAQNTQQCREGPGTDIKVDANSIRRGALQASDQPCEHAASTWTEGSLAEPRRGNQLVENAAGSMRACRTVHCGSMLLVDELFLVARHSPSAVHRAALTALRSICTHSFGAVAGRWPQVRSCVLHLLGAAQAPSGTVSAQPSSCRESLGGALTQADSIAAQALRLAGDFLCSMYINCTRLSLQSEVPLSQHPQGETSATGSWRPDSGAAPDSPKLSNSQQAKMASAAPDSPKLSNSQQTKMASAAPDSPKLSNSQQAKMASAAHKTADVDDRDDPPDHVAPSTCTICKGSHDERRSGRFAVLPVASEFMMAHKAVPSSASNGQRESSQCDRRGGTQEPSPALRAIQAAQEFVHDILPGATAGMQSLRAAVLCAAATIPMALWDLLPEQCTSAALQAASHHACKDSSSAARSGALRAVQAILSLHTLAVAPEAAAAAILAAAAAVSDPAASVRIAAASTVASCAALARLAACGELEDGDGDFVVDGYRESPMHVVCRIGDAAGAGLGKSFPEEGGVHGTAANGSNSPVSWEQRVLADVEGLQVVGEEGHGRSAAGASVTTASGTTHLSVSTLFPAHLWLRVRDAALTACHRGDKLRPHGLRAICCLASVHPVEFMPLHCCAAQHGPFGGCGGGLDGWQGWFRSASSAVIECLGSGSSKVGWNAAIAAGQLLARGSDGKWLLTAQMAAPLVLQLRRVVRGSSSFKVRIHAACALLAPGVQLQLQDTQARAGLLTDIAIALIGREGVAEVACRDHARAALSSQPAASSLASHTHVSNVFKGKHSLDRTRGATWTEQQADATVSSGEHEKSASERPFEISVTASKEHNGEATVQSGDTVTAAAADEVTVAADEGRGMSTHSRQDDSAANFRYHATLQQRLADVLLMYVDVFTEQDATTLTEDGAMALVGALQMIVEDSMSTGKAECYAQVCFVHCFGGGEPQIM
jgi:hypothetical protein